MIRSNLRVDANWRRLQEPKDLHKISAYIPGLFHPFVTPQLVHLDEQVVGVVIVGELLCDLK